MFLPSMNVSLWAGVRVTASQSLPPMTGMEESREERIFLLPPAWSQWWCVLTMAVRLRVDLADSRWGVTLGAVLVGTGRCRGEGMLLRWVCWVDYDCVFGGVVADEVGVIVG